MVGGVLRFLTADASKFTPTVAVRDSSSMKDSSIRNVISKIPPSNQETTPTNVPTAELNTEDQSRIYGELTKLHEQFGTVSNDQSLTTLQRTNELRAIDERQKQLTMQADTRVNGWQCIVTDVTPADKRFRSDLANMHWVVRCKFEDLNFVLWSQSDAQLIDIRKGSVVNFDHAAAEL
jgi:hypothetical protein